MLGCGEDEIPPLRFAAVGMTGGKDAAVGMTGTNNINAHNQTTLW